MTVEVPQDGVRSGVSPQINPPRKEHTKLTLNILRKSENQQQHALILDQHNGFPMSTADPTSQEQAADIDRSVSNKWSSDGGDKVKLTQQKDRMDESARRRDLTSS